MVWYQKNRTNYYKHEDNGYKCIISNDYDLIIKEINDYMQDDSIKFNSC